MARYIPTTPTKQHEISQKKIFDHKRTNQNEMKWTFNFFRNYLSNDLVLFKASMTRCLTTTKQQRLSQIFQNFTKISLTTQERRWTLNFRKFPMFSRLQWVLIRTYVNKLKCVLRPWHNRPRTSHVLFFRHDRRFYVSSIESLSIHILGVLSLHIHIIQ